MKNDHTTGRQADTTRAQQTTLVDELGCTVHRSKQHVAAERHSVQAADRNSVVILSQQPGMFARSSPPASGAGHTHAVVVGSLSS